jgi:AraC-like DNA-binding protein
MPTAELVIRIAVFTELVILVAVLLRDSRGNRSYRCAALLLLGVAAYCLAPLVLGVWQWGWPGYPIILLAIVVPVLFWYFVNAVFSDALSVHPAVLWLALSTAVVGLLTLATGRGESLQAGQGLATALDWVSQISKFAWLAAAFVALLRGWQADLVESRRRLRRLIVVATGCYIGAVLVIELFLPDPIPSWIEMLNMCMLLLATSSLCLYFLSLRESNVFAAMAASAAVTEPTHSALAVAVLALMDKERAYASDALSIKSLADQLRTQSHQLRLVINGELGYRNFNAFINQYRIEEVAHRLAQPEFRDTPLLTLALEAGFRSLAPFNRSFKDHYNVTPSDYRQKIINQN